jgi:glutamate synthase (NADPH/NADH)
MTEALDIICAQAEEAVRTGHTYLILSDRQASKSFLPVSPLLAVGAVHHHLIEKRLRMSCALLVETGEAREIHHMCLLLGYGADAICPYLVFETVKNLNEQKMLNTLYTNEEIFQNYVDACHFGIRKVMAKMGISTLQSYKGAQIFEVGYLKFLFRV